MASSKINSSAYSSSSSVIATAAQNLILNPISKVLWKAFIDLQLPYFIEPIAQVVLLSITLYYFPRGFTIWWFVLDMVCRMWSSPSHASLSDVVYVQGVKYTEQHNYKAANIYYAYATFCRIVCYVILALCGYFFGPWLISAFGVQDLTPRMALSVFMCTNYFNYGQEVETRRMFALNHMVRIEVLYTTIFPILELLVFLIYGLSLASSAALPAFMVFSVTEFIARTLPNLVVLLSQVSVLKRYLINDMQLSLNLRYLFPFKKDILQFMLLKLLENIIYYADEYLFFPLSFLISEKTQTNNLELEDLHRISNILYIIITNLSLAIPRAVTDSAVRFVCANGLANAVDRIRQFLRQCMLYLLICSAVFSVLLYLILPYIFVLLGNCLSPEERLLDRRIGVLGEAREAALTGFLAAPYVLMTNVARLGNLNHGILAMYAEGIIVLIDIAILVLAAFTASGANAMQAITVAALVKFAVGTTLYFSTSAELVLQQRDRQLSKKGASSRTESARGSLGPSKGGILIEKAGASPKDADKCESFENLKEFEEMQVGISNLTGLSEVLGNQSPLISNRRSRYEDQQPVSALGVRRQLNAEHSQGTSDGDLTREE